MTAYQIVSDLLRMREEMWNINAQDTLIPVERNAPVQDERFDIYYFIVNNDNLKRIKIKV